MGYSEASSPTFVPGAEEHMYLYDVFISFRGEETRGNFVSFLYEAFADAAIVAFKDDKQLWQGGEINPELMRAIRGSRISVVVFSNGYVDSRWCLDELVEIVDSRKTTGQLVLPVFYSVDRHCMMRQSGHFAEAFANHERRFNQEKIVRWREALTEAANLMGLNANGNDEAVLVKKIVSRVETEFQDQKILPPARFQAGLVDSNATQIFAPSKGLSPCPAIDVYLSFRGPDTRLKFTSHLFHALEDAGVNTYIDRGTRFLGQDISSYLQLLRTSRISVVVISRGFADSVFCLKELAEMMECRRTIGQLVLPVFYHVDPSDVRRQKGTFRTALLKHEEKFGLETVARWRAALTEAGSLSGWVLQNSANSGEGPVVKEIVRRVSIALNDCKYLHVATFPVALSSRMPVLNKLLHPESGGVRFVGISGMGGIGKTTVAKAVYNQLNHLFDCKSFLADVRVTSERYNDVIPLQQQLVDDILKLKNTLAVRNVDDGVSILKERLRAKKALVILDDVSDLDQIKKLAGARDWFGPGSRVIITTRNPDLLKAIEVDCIYDVEALNFDESFELFSSHAFREHNPEEEFIELSTEVVSYCKGVPLALEVLGASLHGKSVEDWRITIDKLKVIPDCRIQTQLRISFDALGSDDRAKEVFLDIACFFVGWDKDYVVRILESCGLFAKKGIPDLINRCLVEVDEKNKLKMHDLLRDMGREIVRGEFPDRPEKRSRLWFHEDILSILRSRLGREEVTGIALDQSESNYLKLSGEAFAMLKRLRLLKLNHVHIDGEYGHISRDLRWLCWHNFSLEFIPKDFYMGQLVAIDMQYSNLREVWKNNRHLENLKVLNLSHSHFLTRTPDFSNLPNLEELILKDCAELVNVHPSIGQLQRLDLVNLKDCKKLKNFPESFCRIKSLRTVNISGCSKIGKLPEDMGQMESLTKFVADGISIAEVPLTIACLKNLTYFSLCGCKRSNSSSISSLVRSLVSSRQIPESSNMLIASLSRLSSLKVLKLVDCDLLGDEIRDNIGGFLSLESLDLRKNKYRSLPDTICQLTALKTLLLDDCRSLESVPDMPPSLLSLSAVNCVSLQRISFPQFGRGTRLFLSNCQQLKMIHGLDHQMLDGSIHLESCRNLSSEFQDFLLKDWCGNVFLPGNKIPEWFDHGTTGSTLPFEIPRFQCSQLKGFTICVIYASTTDTEEVMPYPSVRIEPLGISFSAETYANVATTSDDHMWVFHLPDSISDNWLNCTDKVTISADFGVGWDVKGLGVHCRRGMIPVDVNNTVDLDPPQKGVEDGSRKIGRNAKEMALKKPSEGEPGHKRSSETSHQETTGNSTLSSTVAAKKLQHSPIGQDTLSASCHSSNFSEASGDCDGEHGSLDQYEVSLAIHPHKSRFQCAARSAPDTEPFKAWLGTRRINEMIPADVDTAADPPKARPNQKRYTDYVEDGSRKRGRRAMEMSWKRFLESDPIHKRACKTSHPETSAS